MSSNKLIGDAGEYLIAYNLARRGISPALMNQGAKAVDILCTIDGSKVVSIQVKSSWARTAPRQWMVGKYKPNPSLNYFYIFCNIFELDGDRTREPEIFIVPSQIIYDLVNWNASVPLFKLSKNDEDLYKNNWDAIISILKGDIDNHGY